MPGRTIALLHPGEMGAAIGACLAACGHRLLWASDGRSPETTTRARTAGLEERGSIAGCVAEAEVVLSVCPPHAVLQLAREVSAAGFKGTYVDANAIAPGTAREVGRIVATAGAAFVDGGIVGLPPARGVHSRLYLAGGPVRDVAGLFAGSTMEAVVLDGPAGAASALKNCYAAWAKGTQALLGGIRALARHEGVEEALLAEWEVSQRGLVARSEGLLGNARKGWRWIGEMEQLALAMEAAGLPGGFYDAAAEISRRLEGFKDRPRPVDYAEITNALLRAGR
jgi:3-hydroxyisobutyrate dehydrogenase-like beta-hydroxyacid dehydrogenase